jgi:hypothetical protein
MQKLQEEDDDFKRELLRLVDENGEKKSNNLPLYWKQ